MKMLKFGVLVLGAVALAPSAALAQACIGTPAGQGQYAIEGVMGVSDGFKTYGGGVLANLSGPLSVGANVGVLTPDGNGSNVTSFGATAAYDIVPASRLSACPVVGASYSDFGSDLDISTITVPVGLGLGTTLNTGAANVTLFAVPQWLWMRSSMGDESNSDSEFGLNAGLRFGTSKVYAGGGVGITTADESDPVFNFGVGFVLGRGR